MITTLRSMACLSSFLTSPLDYRGRAVSSSCKVGSLGLNLLERICEYLALKMSQMLPALTVLVLDAYQETPSTYMSRGAGAVAASFKSLEQLILEDWVFSAQDLSIISQQLPKLRHLTLRASLHDSSPSAASDLAIGIGHLARMTSLESLRIIWHGVHHAKESWQPLESLTQLNTLHVVGCYQFGKDVPHLATRMPLLTDINLTAPMSNEILEGLAHLQHLTTLKLMIPDNLLEVVGALRLLTHLRQLELFVPESYDSEFMEAEELWEGHNPSSVQAPQVTALTLSGAHVERDNFFRNMCDALPGLTTLNLAHAHIEEIQGLHELSRLTGLETLSVEASFGGALAKAAPGLCRLASLKSLHWRGGLLQSKMRPDDLSLLLAPGVERLSLVFETGEVAVRFQLNE
eukprot:scaffold173951_cov40-Prasinocladus_malaysianus.AAC.1